jgi:uncharacterized protein (DUF362 family)
MGPAPTTCDSLVAVVRSRPRYGELPEPVSAPELPGGVVTSEAALAVRNLFRRWQLDRVNEGSPSWNPLGELIPEGSRIVLKPNLVLHYNKSSHGLDCLITHPSVIEAVLEYVVLTRPSAVTVGDAPVQGCDFDDLRRTCDLDSIADRFTRRGVPVSIVDFRRTIFMGDAAGGERVENLRPMDRYVLFDLKENSLLEPLARDAERFRVTMYNPDLLQRTHGPGRHQYLVAREIIEADVVLNLPKLKSHKKAGITGALKNMIGMNGNKEYLPHHRKGGGASGGDCYAGSSWLKSRAEDMLDSANRRAGTAQAVLMRSAEILAGLAETLGDNNDLEGSWYGNDTVWRTCLDLQRILHYGAADATVRDQRQRRIITITDAMIGGEGEGPLANTPVPSGFLSGGTNVAAVEWCNARLMGFDPARVPVTREAFGPFAQPLATFGPDEIRVNAPAGLHRAAELVPFEGRAFKPSSGWAGHCELAYAATRQ